MKECEVYYCGAKHYQHGYCMHHLILSKKPVIEVDIHGADIDCIEVTNNYFDRYQNKYKLSGVSAKGVIFEYWQWGRIIAYRKRSGSGSECYFIAEGL